MEDNMVTIELNKTNYEFSSKDLKLMDSMLIPDATQNNRDIEQKKLINKIISLQYTVLSSLLVRAPAWKDSPSIGKGVFLESSYFRNLRATSQ